jgi:CubicO group peptidase (beta-lactamase class C family)
MQAPLHGTCDAAFHAVRDAFKNNFIEHGEIGAAVYITVDGVKVVDLWGGFSSPQKTAMWQEDQLVNAFSIGKGVTAVVAAQCVAKGLITYDTRVASLWSEFAVHGKEDLTLRDLLGHRAGLPAVRNRLPPNAMFDWKRMTEALADEKPWWTPGQQHGYHVNTYGFLVGEMLRRATGESVGQLISEYIAQPLHAEIYLGTPAHLHSRIADYEWPNDPFPEHEPAGLDEEQLLQFNTYYNPSGLSGAGVVNSAPWRLAEMPSTNVHASARAISNLYTFLAYGGSHSGIELLPSEVLDIASSEVSIGDDQILHRTSRFAHGFQLPIPERGFGPNPQSFGHFGAGGSVGFCDPKAKVGFGYVMNQMGPRWQNPRNRALIDSLYSCLQ